MIWIIPQLEGNLSDIASDLFATIVLFTNHISFATDSSVLRFEARRWLLGWQNFLSRRQRTLWPPRERNIQISRRRRFNQ